MALKLAILCTHPIQYYAPLFRRLAEKKHLEPHVFYGWTGSMEATYDPGFDRDVEWDIPLLKGYPHTFVPNEASDPGAHHFRGLVNPSMISQVESWGAEAILVFGWAWQSHFRSLLHFHGRIPVFFRGDSTLLDERPGPRKLARRAWLWWVYRHVDRALYVGENNRTYFEAHGLSDDQLTWVPHAIHNERFADPDGTFANRAEQWRDDLDISPDAPVFLFAGKLEAKKAPDVLLGAFLELEEQAAHLVVVGDGPMAESLRSRGNEHPRVHFLGFQNQSRMPVVYRLGDVFVLPSRGPNETWGLAVNEAMACGRPVVVTDRVGCAPDLIDDGENGHVVPADDASALRGVLASLARQPDRRVEMGGRSASRISEWSIAAAANRLEAAVRDHVSFAASGRAVHVDAH